jgi:predicted aldo/keto reductase-like oxidoreductase
MERNSEALEYIRLGKTDMMVSRLGFGGIPIQRVSEEEAIGVVKRCLEHDITFIDTANAYTTSEERIGKAISGQRSKVILATKSTSRNNEEISSHLQLSLKRLGVDYIDLYQLHNVSDFGTLEKLLQPDGPVAFLEQAKKKGKIRHIGITSHQIDVAKEAVKSDRFETIMFPFNFITCEAADELLPLAREHDVGFIAMKPLGGGMLTNAGIAFKFLLQFPDIIIITGIEKIEEIDEIMDLMAGELTMTELEQEEMDQMRLELGTRFCRRCDYCQPCTVEIPISSAMGFRSIVKRLPPERLFAGKFADTMEQAANCTECGECEERCPYQLPVREILQEQVHLYQQEKLKYERQLAVN